MNTVMIGILAVAISFGLMTWGAWGTYDSYNEGQRQTQMAGAIERVGIALSAFRDQRNRFPTPTEAVTVLGSALSPIASRSISIQYQLVNENAELCFVTNGAQTINRRIFIRMAESASIDTATSCSTLAADQSNPGWLASGSAFLIARYRL